jgi:hypothetical protein
MFKLLIFISFILLSLSFPFSLSLSAPLMVSAVAAVYADAIIVYTPLHYHPSLTQSAVGLMVEMAC